MLRTYGYPPKSIICLFLACTSLGESGKINFTTDAAIGPNSDYIDDEEKSHRALDSGLDEMAIQTPP